MVIMIGKNRTLLIAYLMQPVFLIIRTKNPPPLDILSPQQLSLPIKPIHLPVGFFVEITVLVRLQGLSFTKKRYRRGILFLEINLFPAISPDKDIALLFGQQRNLIIMPPSLSHTRASTIHPIIETLHTQGNPALNQQIFLFIRKISCIRINWISGHGTKL